MSVILYSLLVVKNHPIPMCHLVLIMMMVVIVVDLLFLVESKYLTQLLINKYGPCHRDGICSHSNLHDNSEETLTILPVQLISFGN